jgi:hypothetical protein
MDLTGLFPWKDICGLTAVWIGQVGVGVYLICRGLADLYRARRDRRRAKSNGGG